jgi:hypothetical protein
MERKRDVVARQAKADDWFRPGFTAVASAAA